MQQKRPLFCTVHGIGGGIILPVKLTYLPFYPLLFHSYLIQACALLIDDVLKVLCLTSVHVIGPLEALALWKKEWSGRVASIDVSCVLKSICGAPLVVVHISNLHVYVANIRG